MEKICGSRRMLCLPTAKMNVLLVFSLIAVITTTSCANTGPYTKDEVISSFHDIAKHQTLPERQSIYYVWSTQLILGHVKYIKEKDAYEIEFPDMKLEGEEVWGIDMKASTIWPVNVRALMSAVALFCGDRNDKRLDCQRWLTLLEDLKQNIEK